jgi:predicted PurR-regulated permease PerM
MSHPLSDGPRPSSTTPAQLSVQLVLGAGAGTALVLLLWPLLPALVTAGVLALILLPLHRRLERSTGRADAAAALATVAGVIGLLIPLFVLGSLVLGELAQAVAWLQREGPAMLASLPRLERSAEAWIARLGLSNVEVGEAVAARVEDVPGALLGRTFGFLAGVGGAVLQLGVALFTLFFLLRDSESIEGRLSAIVPLEAHRTSALLYRTREVVSAAVYGNLLVALTQGTLGGLAFLALGLPTPALWGCVMAAGSLVPMVGPGVIWLPTGILLLATGSVLRGILLLAFGVLVISTVDNVIRSFLVGARARIHPLAIFLGVLGGILLFGAVGVFVGPVLLVVSLLLLEMVRLSLFPGGTAVTPYAEPEPGAGPAPVTGEPLRTPR